MVWQIAVNAPSRSPRWLLPDTRKVSIKSPAEPHRRLIAITKPYRASTRPVTSRGEALATTIQGFGMNWPVPAIPYMAAAVAATTATHAEATRPVAIHVPMIRPVETPVGAILTVGGMSVIGKNIVRRHAGLNGSVWPRTTAAIATGTHPSSTAMSLLASGTAITDKGDAPCALALKAERACGAS
jgi:hypothetical protein